MALKTPSGLGRSGTRAGGRARRLGVVALAALVAVCSVAQTAPAVGASTATAAKAAGSVAWTTSAGAAFSKQLDAESAIDRYFDLGEKVLEAQRDFAKSLMGAATSVGVGSHDDQMRAPEPAPMGANGTPKA